MINDFQVGDRVILASASGARGYLNKVGNIVSYYGRVRNWEVWRVRFDTVDDRKGKECWWWRLSHLLISRQDHLFVYGDKDRGNNTSNVPHDIIPAVTGKE